MSACSPRTLRIEPTWTKTVHNVTFGSVPSVVVLTCRYYIKTEKDYPKSTLPYLYTCTDPRSTVTLCYVVMPNPCNYIHFTRGPSSRSIQQYRLTFPATQIDVVKWIAGEATAVPTITSVHLLANCAVVTTFTAVNAPLVIRGASRFAHDWKHPQCAICDSRFTRILLVGYVHSV